MNPVYAMVTKPTGQSPQVRLYIINTINKVIHKVRHSSVCWCICLFPGILFGLSEGCVDSKLFPPDVTLPWLRLALNEASVSWPIDGIEEVFVLAKQGKSLRYQLWEFESVAQSNKQLKEMDPQRASDGTRYVLPPGGVQDGLAGQVLLLHTNTQQTLSWALMHFSIPPLGGLIVLVIMRKHEQSYHGGFFFINILIITG